MRRHYGVKTERYKLIHFYGEDIDEWELFDLESDPLEMNNLYGEPGNELLVNDLKAELKRLQILYEGRF